MTGIAERYAKALFELADQDKALDGVADDLRGLKTALAESDDLTRLIRSPRLKRREQAAAMAAILEKAGATELTRKFVGLVAANRRLFALPRMIDRYLAELAAKRGEATAYVTSGQPLSESQRAKLIEMLKSAIGAKVSVDVSVDPALIGGLVVRIGSLMVDASLSAKLERLRSQLRAA